MNDQTKLLLTQLRNTVAKNTIDSFEQMRHSGEYEALETALKGFGKCKRAIGTLEDEFDPMRVRTSRKVSRKVADDQYFDTGL